MPLFFLTQALDVNVWIEVTTVQYREYGLALLDFSYC